MIMRFLGRRVSEWASNQQNWTVWRLRGFLSTSELIWIQPDLYGLLTKVQHPPCMWSKFATICHHFLYKGLKPLFCPSKAGVSLIQCWPVISLFHHHWVGFFLKLGSHRLSISIYIKLDASNISVILGNNFLLCITVGYKITN